MSGVVAFFFYILHEKQEERNSAELWRQSSLCKAFCVIY